jgi:arylsulfatase A
MRERMQITRRAFVTGSTAFALAACARAPRRPAGGHGPNFLFILADDLGRECLGSYGGTSYATPRLDELARGGLRFGHCFAMPKCHPTRVSLMTGRYPFRVNARWGSFPTTEVTFAHVLARAGYATAVSGKWQLAMLRQDPTHPVKAGFQTSCLWGWHEGAQYWQPVIYQDGVLRQDLAHAYGPDVHTDFLIEFARRQGNNPFLAYYPMTLPHLSSVGADGAPGAKISTYPELVDEMDRQVGRLLDAFAELGVLDQTLVLFAADNGSPGNVSSELNGRVIQGGKSSLSDAGTRVPLLARWPGVVPEGKVCEDLIDVSDFFPTLAELGRAELPAGVTLDGHSFAPQLRGEAGQPREWVYAGFNGRSFLRDERWKLTYSGELYDLTRDPEEFAPIGAGQDDAEAAAARAQLTKYVRGYFPGQTLP